MEITKNEHESLGEATDFFSSPPITTSEEESYFMKIHTATSTQNEAPLIYEFDVDDGHYADLSQCTHYIRFRIMKGDRITPIPAIVAGAVAGDEHKVAPINYFGNTLFANAELYLNNELLETSNNLYPYKAIIQTFLSYGKEVKNTQLAISGYYEDTGAIDTDAIRGGMATAACANSGLRKRYLLSHTSTPFATLSPLHFDFCGQPKYIQNRTQVKIRLTRVRPQFGLMANADDQDFSVIIQDSYLLVRMVRPRESLRLAVEQALETNLVKYPMKQCEMRFFTNSGTSNTITEPNLYSGHLPTRVALGLVTTSSLDGNLKASPFSFQHFNVSEIDLKVNGKSVTTDPLKIDLTHDDYILPYSMMFRNTGGILNNEAIISYSQYKTGHFLYIFDLTEDNDHDMDHFHHPRTGVISLDIRVTAPPGFPVSIVAMFEKEVIVTCDKDRTYNIIS